VFQNELLLNGSVLYVYNSLAAVALGYLTGLAPTWSSLTEGAVGVGHCAVGLQAITMRKAKSL
jgi:hypothetical protein